MEYVDDAANPTTSCDDEHADIISTLPDDVLVSILRLVGDDASELVRTGALSRRWRGLWTRVAALRFDAGPEHWSPADADRFVAFVDGVVARHTQPPVGPGIEQLGIFLNLLYAPGEPAVPATTVEAAQGWIRYAVEQGLTSFAFVVRVMSTKWLLDDYTYSEDDDQADDGHGHGVVNGDDDLEEEQDEQEEELEEEEESYIDYDEGDDDEDTPFVALADLLSSTKREVQDTTSVITLDDLPSSTKLETLHLFLGGSGLRLPHDAVFTSLTDLALECFEIGADGGDLGRLLSPACCPRLQKLRLWAVNFKRARAKELVLDTGTLVELTMYSMDQMESLELRAPNLRVLKVESCHELRRLTVSSASSLEQLVFSDNRLGAVTNVDLPCVRHLWIGLVSHMFQDSDINDTDISLLNKCSSATSLVVDLDVPSEIERRVDVIKDKIPQLPNITTLAVKFHPICERHSFGDGVAGLLTRLNNLRYLILQLDEVPGCIKRDEYLPQDADGDLAFVCDHADNWISNNVSLANLRKAEFRGLTGTGCELRFLRFVLASATDLEEVIVRFSLNSYGLEARTDDFLLGLLGDGTWTAFENKSYEWRP